MCGNKSANRRNAIKLSLANTLQKRISTTTQQLLTRASNDIETLRTYLKPSTDLSIGILASLLLLSTSVHAEIPNTAPSTSLYDEAEVIQKGNEELFSTAATAIESSTGIRVKFVMAKTVPYGETPTEYANELFHEWKLDENDVLLVASPKLARAGLAAGSNAAQTLTPTIIESICNETYSLKAGDERYGAAILDVSNRLIPILNGKQDPGPPDLSTKEVVQNFKTKQQTSQGRNKYVVVVGGILVIAFVAPMVQTFWYIKND